MRPNGKISSKFEVYNSIDAALGGKQGIPRPTPFSLKNTQQKKLTSTLSPASSEKKRQQSPPAGQLKKSI